MLIHGRCHCGNIAFDLLWTPDPPEIPARACSCSFCTRHGGVWTSDPGGMLTITVGDTSDLSRYAFGTLTAEFHVCRCCGVVPVATSRIGERLYAVVNVNTFEQVDPRLLRYVSSKLDDESETERLERRKRLWIAQVDYAKPAT